MHYIGNPRLFFNKKVKTQKLFQSAPTALVFLLRLG
jgi:hypothetical protein